MIGLYFLLLFAVVWILDLWKPAEKELIDPFDERCVNCLTVS